MIDLMNNFKKNNNRFFKKRSQFLTNQERMKQFSSKVREEYAPAANDNEGSDYENQDENSQEKPRKGRGNQAEIERIRLKIEENKEKGLS